MNFISYAKNAEDVLLWRVFKNIQHGFYVDIGATSPTNNSVTRAFYDQGWSGIDVACATSDVEDFNAPRTRDIILRCHVSDTVVPHEIPTQTLLQILETYAPSDIHFLKIDTKGCEQNLLRSNDWRKYRPWVIVVESEIKGTPSKHASWEKLLTKHRYVFAYADGLNRFYVAHEHLKLKAALSQPVCLFDDFIRHNEYELAHQVQSLNQSNHEWRTKFEETQAKLEELHGFYEQLTASKKKQPFGIFAPPLKHTMAFILARPALKQRAMGWLRHKPELTAQLYQFGLQKHLVYDARAARIENSAIDFGSLSSRAQKFVLQLQQSIKKT